MKVRRVLAAWAIAVVPIIALAGSASAYTGGGTGGGEGRGCACGPVVVGPGKSGTTPGVDKGAKKGWDKPGNPHYTAPDNGDGSSGGSGGIGGGGGA